MGNVVESRQGHAMGSGILGMHVRSLCVKHTCVFVKHVCVCDPCVSVEHAYAYLAHLTRT